MKIEVAGIKKAYSRKKVLTDISFSMDAGSCAAILGSNGSGKSTLLSILAGVRRADGGSFFYKGTDLLRHPRQIPKALGYVPQGDPLMEELNAWDNLRMWYDRETLKRELADGALGLLGIDGFLKTPVRRMSGGMKNDFPSAVRWFPIPGFWCWMSPRLHLTRSVRKTSAVICKFIEKRVASC